MIQNPYTLTTGSSERSDCREATHRSHSLSFAASLYKAMGWTGICYVVIALSVILWSEANRPSMGFGVLFGLAVGMSALAYLFAGVLWVATRLESDIETVYVRARWYGLLAGALGFPFLTIPAFYALKLISRGRTVPLQTGNENVNLPPRE